MSEYWIHLLWVAAGAGALSLGIGAIVRAHGASVRLVDVPNDRSSHATPTPRGGGLGMVAGTLCGALLLQRLGVKFDAAELTVLVCGGLLVATVSLLDDLWSLPAVARLGIHLAAGTFAAFLVGAVPIESFAPSTVVDAGWPALLITILWIAGMTNAYNFMDGIDGLAGAQAITAACALAMVGWWLGRGDLTAVGLLIAASSLGFLVHNWSPARLFMGDVGSAFLGYSLAVLTVMAAKERSPALLAGAIVLWPFVFDPIYTMAGRAWRRENLLAAHRSHLYQRLVATGWSHRMVCGLYTILAALGAGAGVALVAGARWAPAATLIYAVGTVMLVSGLVWVRELRTPPPVGVRPGPDQA